VEQHRYSSGDRFVSENETTSDRCDPAGYCECTSTAMGEAFSDLNSTTMHSHLLFLSSVLTLTLSLSACTKPSPKANATEIEPWNKADKPMSKPQPDPKIQSRSSSDRSYQQVIDGTTGMISDGEAQALARQYGLNILDITWEDTGRFKNSAVGPNISDMTIQVQQYKTGTKDYSLHLMPVIRFPNFADKTADVKLDELFVKVGNEKGTALQKVALRDVLENLRNYLTVPNSWKGSQSSLLAPRDTHILVSAQACFLPIPQGGIAKFNPVLFNYQSSAREPAVLSILATREGTSVTVIDNQRDGFEAGRTWGQRLFFNKNGQRASLTGKRASDFQEDGRDRPSSPMTSAAAEEQGLNLVMLIQVPLKQKEIRRTMFNAPMSDSFGGSAAVSEMARQKSDVEAAVIGHGEVEGPFTEIDNLAIERDPRYPIRVTVQFYKGTSNGVVSATDMKDIHQQIQRVYQDADYVGSLVVDGNTSRPTEHDGPQQEPPDWWANFWKRYESNTGQSREEALQMLRRLRGKHWMPESEEDLRRSLDEVQ
jgi:hypothetical protein